MRVENRLLRAKVLLFAIIVTAVLLVGGSLAWAVPKVRKIDTANVTEFSEPRAAGVSELESGGTRKHEDKAAGNKEVLPEGEHKSGEEPAEEHEESPAWMIPGWQSLFALLSVGYLALAVVFLPKVIAKEEGHH